MIKKTFLLISIFLLIIPFISAESFYHNRTLSSSDSVTQGFGFGFKVNTTGLFNNVTRVNLVTATRAYLYNGSTLETISSNLSGDTFLFNNITLLPNINYTILMCSAGSAYTRYYLASVPTWPLVANNNSIGFNWTYQATAATCGNAPTTSGGEIYNIQAIGFTGYTTLSNFTITGSDYYTGTILNNLSVTISNYTTTLNYTTSSGNITTTINASQGRLMNVTVSSNDNGGYFNQTYINWNTSFLLIANLSQSVNTFTAIEKITNRSITGASFYTNYLTNGTHYMRAQNYNLTSYRSGYYNNTVLYTANALNITSYNMTLFNQTINISARNSLNGTSINTFNLSVYNSTYGFIETYINVSNSIILNLTSGIVYTIVVNASNYLGNTTNFSSSSNTSNFSVSLVANNQVYLAFYDEQTLNSVTQVNFTIVGSTYGQVGFTGSSNNFTLSNLLSDTYEIRYFQMGGNSSNPTLTGGNYTIRSYFFSVPLVAGSQNNISLYMLRTDNATSFVLYATDTYNQPKSGLTASLLRRYVSTTSHNIMLLK